MVHGMVLPVGQATAMTRSKVDFQPTSLDIINHPNPVEPVYRPNAATRQQRDRQRQEDVFRSLQEVGHASSAQQNPLANFVTENGPIIAYEARRDVSQAMFTLPMPSQSGVHRHRNQFPPVLQGLHQPPPNAGILPSMSASDHQHPRSALPKSYQSVDINALSTPESESNPSRLGAPEQKFAKDANAFQNAYARIEDSPNDTWGGTLGSTNYPFTQRSVIEAEERAHAISSAKTPPVTTTTKVLQNQRAEHSRNSAVLRSHDDDMPALEQVEQPTMRAKRRPRTKWSVEEDEALLAGFQRYGASWTSIQLDPAVSKRTPTDIRDRIRIRFPAEYAKAGLVPKRPRQRRQKDGSSHEAVSKRLMSRQALSNQSTSSKATSRQFVRSVQAASVGRTPADAAPHLARSQRATGSSGTISGIEGPWFEDTPFSLIQMNLTGPGIRGHVTHQ